MHSISFNDMASIRIWIQEQETSTAFKKESGELFPTGIISILKRRK